MPLDKVYTQYPYLSSQHGHPHVSRLVQLIEELPGLTKTSRIVEVGSNDGSFLQLLRNEGYERALGVEAARHAQEAARQRGVETVDGFFNQEVARQLVETYGRYDLLVALSVLEHVSGLQDFREAIAILLRPGGYVLIEVPNFDFSLTAPDYSGIHEDICNFFTLATLKRFLAETGIRVIHTEIVPYVSETLIAVGESVGKPLAMPPQEDVRKLQEKAFAYRDRWPKFQEAFIGYLREYRKGGGKVALYGAGNQGSSLTNFVGLGPCIEFALDDQLEKQGKYMPGSRLPILPGEALEGHDIDLCLLAVNPENEEAVMARYPKYREKGGRFASLSPPSSLLPPFWNRI